MSTITPAHETSRSDKPGAELPPCGEMALQKPLPEHEWLQRFVGEWETDIEVDCGPGRSPMKSKGRERARILGGFWLVIEGHNEDFPYVFQLTLGYDPSQRRYVGTWIDSMSSHLWRYSGATDASGQTLTLETEGPFPPGPDGTPTRFREVTEFKSDDHRVFTSSRLTDAGAWVPLLRIEFRRRAGA